MLAIKLQRIGKKHKPSYRVVVAERRSKLIGPPVEDVGFFDPFTKMASLKKERLLHWVKMGAQPTRTVHNLLVKEGVLKEPKMAVPMKKKAATAEAPQEGAAAPAVAKAEAPVTEAKE